MKQGWIGAWSPGIGDPTVGGWITVALYAWASWMAWRLLRRERGGRVLLLGNEGAIWRLLLVGMIMLGINKQLDLQSALTEFARILANEQGWYGNRRQYQEAFVAALPVVGLTGFAALWIVAWKAHAFTLMACAGATGLIVFVIIRAASFHHVDAMLGWRLGGIPLNWMLEMSPLLVVGWSAKKRGRVRI